MHDNCDLPEEKLDQPLMASPKRSRNICAAIKMLQYHRHTFWMQQFDNTIKSFAAMIWPVATTMLLSSLILSVIKADPNSNEIRSMLIYDDTSKESATTIFEHSVINTLAIIALIGAMTFVLVLFNRFKCVNCINGYMVYAFSMLLTFGSGQIVYNVVQQYELHVDLPSFVMVMFNFGVVGVVAVFYQKGCPDGLHQAYLIAISITLVWNWAHLPEWTTWSVLVGMGIYDLIAVLAPWGPLNLLIKSVEENGTQLSGMLYEVNVSKNSGQTNRSSYRTEVNVDEASASLLEHNSSISDNDDGARKSLEISKYGGIDCTDAKSRGVLARYYSHWFCNVFTPEFAGQEAQLLEHYRNRDEQLINDIEIVRLQVIEHHNDEGANTHLGLGDFIFYSILVARASMHSFAAMIACFITILLGLGGTLLLLPSP